MSLGPKASIKFLIEIVDINYALHKYYFLDRRILKAVSYHIKEYFRNFIRNVFQKKKISNLTC